MGYMDAPPVWSFLFFFMLVNLAISSGCGGVQTLGTFFMDEWPSLRDKRMYVFVGIAAFLFLCGKIIQGIYFRLVTIYANITDSEYVDSK
jgi:hypothetical protein